MSPHKGTGVSMSWGREQGRQPGERPLELLVGAQVLWLQALLGAHLLLCVPVP